MVYANYMELSVSDNVLFLYNVYILREMLEANFIVIYSQEYVIHYIIGNMLSIIVIYLLLI